MLIGEGTIHAYNNLPTNARNETAQTILQETGMFAAMSSPPGTALANDEWPHNFQPSEIEESVFLESDVDFGVYHSLPIFDYFADGWSSLEKGVVLRDRNPERVKLLGCVDPLSDDALEEMERQVADLDVDGFKTYPTFYREGKIRPLRLDDELLPIVEKAHELGSTHIASHKLFPLGPVGIHHTSVEDVADIASMYPEMTFELLHPDLAFLHEIASMLGTHPNVWVNLELTTCYMFLQPRRFAEILGELLVWAPDRVIFGSGPPLVHPQGYIEAFWEFEMPKDLKAGYNYPELTDEVKRMVLGENLLRMHDWDEDALREDLAHDQWSERRETEGRPEPWSVLRSDVAAAGD